MSSQQVVITREDIERLLNELQVIESLMENFEKNMALVLDVIKDLDAAKSLVGLLRSSPNVETLADIGGGIYAKVGVDLSVKPLVAVGAGYLVEMDVDSLLGYIDERLKELNVARENLERNLSALSSRANEIRRFLTYIYSQALRQADVR